MESQSSAAPLTETYEESLVKPLPFEFFLFAFQLGCNIFHKTNFSYFHKPQQKCRRGFLLAKFWYTNPGGI